MQATEKVFWAYFLGLCSMSSRLTDGEHTAECPSRSALPNSARMVRLYDLPSGGAFLT